jgi:hypothetical protein
LDVDGEFYSKSRKKIDKFDYRREKNVKDLNLNVIEFPLPKKEREKDVYVCQRLELNKQKCQREIIKRLNCIAENNRL